MVSQKLWFQLVFAGFVVGTLAFMACRPLAVQPGAPVRPEIAQEADIEEMFVTDESPVEMPVDVWPVFAEQHESTGIDYAYLEAPVFGDVLSALSPALSIQGDSLYLETAPALPISIKAQNGDAGIEVGQALEVSVPLASLPGNVLYWRLYVDGQMVNFSSTEAIELSASLLESLSPGEHDIQVEFLGDEYAPLWKISPALTMNLVSALDAGTGKK